MQQPVINEKLNKPINASKTAIKLDKIPFGAISQ